MNDPLQWIYGTEGNANIVLRYCGSDPALYRKILRVRKCGSDFVNDKPIDQEVAQFSVDFSKKVIAKLLGSKYIIPMKAIGLQSQFLEIIKYNIRLQRPFQRLVHDIDLRSSRGFIAADWTYRWYPQHTMTIELKPKWGFLPSSKYIKPRNRAKKSMCRFCMHALQKKVIPGYCPLDLYSGDGKRRRKALDSLLKHPEQRQLNLYLDGTNCKPHELSSMLHCSPDKSCDAISEILLEILRLNPILEKLKNLQKSLDELDIERIYTLYQTTDPQTLSTNDIDIWKQVVKRFLLRPKNIHTNSDEDIQQCLYEYLLSMTFKDCSIMVSVTPYTSSLDECDTIELDRGCGQNTLFAYDLKVIDVDMKRIEKIPYWFNLDEKIVQFVMKHDLKRACVE